MRRVGPLALIGALWLLLWGFHLISVKNIPPGFHHDEAFNAIDALHLREMGWPVFFPGNSGREPLHIYLMAIFMGLFGPEVWTARLPMAVVWGFTAPALLWLIRELFPERENLAWFPATTFLLLITLPWYGIISHFADRANLFVLMEILFFASLWRSWRLNSLKWGVISGIFWGLSFYTYLANRFLPLILLPLFAWVYFRQRDAFQKRWRLVLVVPFTATLVMAPLLIYFARNLDLFFLRASQVILGNSEETPILSALLENIRKITGMFFLTGDSNPRHNLPRRPIFSWWAFPFFVAGFVSFLLERRGVYGFLALWLIVMLLPTLLTGQAPNFLRASGAIPPLVIVMGLGADRLMRLGKSLGKPKQASLIAGILLLGESINGLIALHRWIYCPDLFHAFDEGLTQVARYIAAYPPSSDIVYVSPRDLNHPTLRFFLEVKGVDQRVRSFDARHVLVVSPEKDARYVIITYEDFRFKLMASWLWPEGGYKEGKMFFDRRMNPYAQVFYVPAGIPLRQPFWKKQIHWQDNVLLLGADPIACCDYHPGDIIYLELWWTAYRNTPANSWTIFTHLLDTQGHLVVGDDSEPGKGSYPTTRWQPGELVITEYQLFIPKDAPSGEYIIEIGLYDWQTGKRLPLADWSGDSVWLGKVYVH